MIPSHPLNLFEILHETFRIFAKIFVRSLLLVLLFVIPFVALVIWAESSTMESAGALLEKSGRVSDAAFTSLRDRVLQQFEEENPGSIARFRASLDASESSPRTDNHIDSSQISTPTPNVVTPTREGLDSVITQLTGSLLILGAACFLLLFFCSGAYAGIVELTARAFEMRRVDLMLVLRAIVRRHVWVVFGYQILLIVGLGILPMLLRGWIVSSHSLAAAFLSFLISVVQLFLEIRLCMAVPAIVSEEIGILPGMKRSWELTTNNWWRVIAISVAFFVGMFFLMVILLVLLSFLDIGRMMDLLRYVMFAPVLSIHKAIQAVIDMVIYAVEIYSIPLTILFIFFPIFTTVFYYDLRTRADGPLSYDADTAPVVLD